MGALPVIASAGVIDPGTNFASLDDANTEADAFLQSDVALGGVTYGYGGLLSWEVDSTPHLAQQQFFVRSGNEAERPLGALTRSWAATSDGDQDAGDERLVVEYLDQAQRFKVLLDYTFAGGTAGSNRSSFSLLVMVTNLTDGVLPLTLFQYTDLDVGATTNNDTVQLMNVNTVRQQDSSPFLVETVTTAAPDTWALLPYGQTVDLLRDNVMDDLPSAIGPFTGDATWAAQWNTQIAPGGVYQVAQGTRLVPVPEPATMALLSLGVVALLQRRRTA